MVNSVRIHLLALAIAVGFLVLLGRLCYIQAASATPIKDDFERHQRAWRLLPAQRGPITDRFGRPLASSLPVRTVEVYLPEFNRENATQAAADLAPLLNVPAATLEEKFTSGRSGQIVLAHDVDFDKAQMAAILRIPGIKFTSAFKRVYPGGPMLCHILGRVSRDEQSLEGLEYTWNDCLQGKPGRREWYTTGRRQMLGAEPVSTVPAMPGSTVTLTIDLGIQTIVEEEMARMVEKFHPEAASAIVMDPNTGDVLAAANYPNFDPNDFGDSIPEARRNRVITDVYEPGSTFKTFILALALDQGAATPTSKFDCEKGLWVVGRRHLHDTHPYGMLSVADILGHSSNIGAAKVALHWGGVTEYDLLHSREPASRARIFNQATRMYNGLTAFGFGRQSNIDLMGEVSGIFHEPKAWTRDSLLSVAMGHEISVTALQLANGYCAVVNGGNLLVPHVILRRTDGVGQLEFERSVEVQAHPISPKTSATMRQLLRGVVEHGTAASADFPGLLLAGKTGTSQKVNPDGTYSHSDYIGSFAGFAPYDNPELVVLVLLDAPDRSKGYYGGTVAAPAVQAILRRSLGMRGELTPEMVEKARLEKKAAQAAARRNADPKPGQAAH